MFCRSCGKEIPDHSKACPACGVRQTITELEYRTGSKSRLGAALKRFRSKPLPMRCAVYLDVTGILCGIAAVLFALLYPYPAADFTTGERAMLVLGGAAVSLGFGHTLCRVAAAFRKSTKSAKPGNRR